MEAATLFALAAAARRPRRLRPGRLQPAGRRGGLAGRPRARGARPRRLPPPGSTRSSAGDRTRRARRRSASSCCAGELAERRPRRPGPPRPRTPSPAARCAPKRGDRVAAPVDAELELDPVLAREGAAVGGLVGDGEAHHLARPGVARENSTSAGISLPARLAPRGPEVQDHGPARRSRPARPRPSRRASARGRPAPARARPARTIETSSSPPSPPHPASAAAAAISARAARVRRIAARLATRSDAAGCGRPGYPARVGMGRLTRIDRRAGAAAPPGRRRAAGRPPGRARLAAAALSPGFRADGGADDR